MTKSEEKNEAKREIFRYHLAKKVALVAVIFSCALSFLMIAHFLQTQSADPLNSAAISQLMLQLKENPNDLVLKEQIRALDLLARRAYFTGKWQIRIGSYLLFTFVLIVLIAFKYMSSKRSQLPDLSKSASSENSWEEKVLARKYMILTGLGLFVVAFDSAYDLFINAFTSENLFCFEGVLREIPINQLHIKVMK